MHSSLYELDNKLISLSYHSIYAFLYFNSFLPLWSLFFENFGQSAFMCPWFPHVKQVKFWVNIEVSFFRKNLFLFRKFKDLSLLKKNPNLYTIRMKFSYSSGRSSSTSSFESTFKAILLDFLSWISCFYSIPSSILCSWSFPNNVVKYIYIYIG